MANEFICSRCGKDGTRCGCPGRAVYRDEDKAREQRIKDNQNLIDHNLFLLSHSHLIK